MKKNLYRGVFAKSFSCICMAVIFFLPAAACADTFVHNETGETYHGYATGKDDAGISEVITVEKGIINVNLSLFDITPDSRGRNNIVGLLTVPSGIAFGLETNAFEESLKNTAAKGPLFIIVEIDSPGGRIDLAMKLCSAIAKTTNCQTYAYINGGSNGGAYSAAAAVALSCNKIYMAPSTVIGAATMIMINSRGMPMDLERALGKEVAEKLNSGWRSYLASLAQNNDRPAALARAMVDKDIEVIEIKDNGKRVFIETVNKAEDQEVVKTWSQKDSLLTLSVKEAIDCGMADKMYNSRQDLLLDHNAVSVEIFEDEAIEEARKLCARIEKSMKKINASLDLGLKQLQATRSRGQAMKAMKSLMTDARFVLGLRRKFGEDVPIDEEKIQDFLNTVQAEYDALKAAGRR